MRPTSPFEPRNHAVLAAALLGLAVASCTQKQPETQTTTTTTTSTVRVSSIDLGRTLSSDRRVVTTDAAFAPTDTVYGAVTLEGPVPASQVTARWTSMDGQTVAETTMPLTASEGEGVTQFQFAPPSGLAPGTYKLDIVQDGQIVSTKEFTVSAP
jgi:hypothetical protein